MDSKVIKRLFIILILIFAVIFVLRFIYELSYRNDYNYGYLGDTGGGYYYDSYRSISNIATTKQMIKGDGGIDINYDQKYEMISKIISGSDDFDGDISKVRQAVSDFSGVIQMEYNSGLEKNNNRSLWISVGVTPGNFDLLVEELKLIGNLTSFSVNKTDKTAEFQSYIAQLESLEKTLDSYNALKTQGSSVGDLLIIEEKIIQTEKEIMQINVTLGVYNENQSMCTVDFTIEEYAETKSGGIEFYMLADSAGYALGWTFMVYGGIVIFVLLTGFAAFGGAFLISRIKKNNNK